MRSFSSERLWRRLMELGGMSDAGEGVTRRSFTPAFQAGRDWLAERFQAAGLHVWTDHAGNLHGLLEGQSPVTLLLGGHSDTVASGGMFDGALGVISALEIAESLNAAGDRPEFSLEVVDFLAEEPSAFGLSCIGSRGFVGNLTQADLDRRSPDGERLGDALRRVGGDPGRLGPVDPDREYLGFLELHIEQGPVLEKRPGSLGVVTDIAGIVRYHFRVQGKASHAGTTPMRERRDALVAGGRLTSGIYEAVSQTSDLIATVGQFEVSPNAVNVVPGRVEGVAEFRSASEEALYDTSRAIMAGALPAKLSLGCDFEFEEYMRTEPVPMSGRLQTTLQRSIEQSGANCIHLFSGAGHDAVEVSRRMEVGMIFCPCRDGLSHSPQEWVEPDDIERALVAYNLAVLNLVVTSNGVRRE